jgi:hypothetical protein
MITAKRQDAQCLRNAAVGMLADIQRESSAAQQYARGSNPAAEANSALYVTANFLESKIEAAMAYLRQAAAQDGAADELANLMREGRREANDFAPTCIHGVEYVDFAARFLGVSNTGSFLIKVLAAPSDMDPRFEMSRSHNDLEPPAGTFGLPEFTEGDICPNVHTVRLATVCARSIGIL